MKKLLIILGLLYIANLSTGGVVTDAILLFLLLGVIPGTHVIVPFWIMMASYCLLITVIVTLYVERSLGLVKSPRSSRAASKTRKGTLPRRRFSHI